MSTTVTLPDGRLLEIPDDISEEKLEELRTKISELYPEAAQEAVSLSPVEQSKDVITPPEDPGFLKRIFSRFFNQEFRFFFKIWYLKMKESMIVGV